MNNIYLEIDIDPNNSKSFSSGNDTVGQNGNVLVDGVAAAVVVGSEGAMVVCRGKLLVLSEVRRRDRA